MVVLRLLGLLALLAIAGSLALYFLSGDRHYLAIAWRVLQFAAAVGLLAALLYTLERLVLVL